MRIDGTYRPAISTRAASRSGAAGSTFQIDNQASAARTPTVANAEPMTPLDALLALQSVDDPLLARRKTLRRGLALVDLLDAIRGDLLLGRIAEGRLNQLVVLIGQVRDPTDPGLDALIDDIELRARVELAKFGRFPQ
jgi:hypothetical protein